MRLLFVPVLMPRVNRSIRLGVTLVVFGVLFDLCGVLKKFEPDISYQWVCGGCLRQEYHDVSNAERQINTGCSTPHSLT